MQPRNLHTVLKHLRLLPRRLQLAVKKQHILLHPVLRPAHQRARKPVLKTAVVDLHRILDQRELHQRHLRDIQGHIPLEPHLARALLDHGRLGLQEGGARAVLKVESDEPLHVGLDGALLGGVLGEVRCDDPGETGGALVEFEVDEFGDEGVVLCEGLGELTELFDAEDGVLELAVGDALVELVHLGLDPAQVAGLALDGEERGGGAVGGEGVEEVAFLEELWVAPGEEGHAVAAAEVVFGLCAESLAELVGGLFELAEELDLFDDVVVLVDEGLLAHAEVDGVEDLALARRVRGRREVDHFDLGEGPAALGDVLDLGGGGVAVFGALLLDSRDEEVVIEEDHVDDAAGLPGGRIELDPVAGLEDDVAAGDGGEELLGALDGLPEGLQVRHVQRREVGDGRAVRALAGGEVGGGERVVGVGLEGGGRVVEVGEEGAEGAHLGLELVDFLGDEDELRAVHEDVLLQVGGGAVADFLEAALVVLDLGVGGVCEHGGDDCGGCGGCGQRGQHRRACGRGAGTYTHRD